MAFMLVTPVLLNGHQSPMRAPSSPPTLGPPQLRPSPAVWRNPRRSSANSRTSCLAVPPLNTAAFDFDQFVRLLYTSQRSICTQLEAQDGREHFCEHPWTSNTGAGLTRVLQQGAVFEKAGVNVSVVQGTLSESRAASMASLGRPLSAGMPYRAAALSLVLHAQSPFIPTLRGDVRLFSAADHVWAGGGADLTIFYVDLEDSANFHRHWKDVCDHFDPALYPAFKTACDDYFFVSARGEHRGTGGIFYDEAPLPEHRLFDFQECVLQNFLPSHERIVEKHRHRQWSAKQKSWQRVRRGRYLEFNLLDDRGVRFGIAGGDVRRTEAIMISAPPSVEWPYALVPEEGSPEWQTVQLLTAPPRQWA